MPTAASLISINPSNNPQGVRGQVLVGWGGGRGGLISPLPAAPTSLSEIKGDTSEMEGEDESAEKTIFLPGFYFGDIF